MMQTVKRATRPLAACDGGKVSAKEWAEIESIRTKKQQKMQPDIEERDERWNRSKVMTACSVQEAGESERAGTVCVPVTMKTAEGTR